MYEGKVIRGESFDPLYKVRFTYSDNACHISNGTALFTRKAPVPVVEFDDYTDYLIEKLELDEKTLQNIKLEVGKTVCDYIFNTMDVKANK